MKAYFFFIIFLLSHSLLIAQETNYLLKKNIPYYERLTDSTDRYIQQRCRLDVYYPENKQNVPAVVWFHGGGLTGGEKFIPEQLKEKGIAVIAVNYRLHPNVSAPAYIEDAAAAVAWAFHNTSTFNGNASSIFVSGHSAGGYLTSMIGLDKKWLAKHNIDANDIAGLIPFSGHTITHLTIRKEQGISETQPIVDEFAPLFHVRADAPPLLLITGDRNMEMLGRYEENAYFMRMMKVVGHTDTRLLELDGYGHSMAEPAFPLLLNEITRISDQRK